MIFGSRKYASVLEAIRGKYEVRSSGCWEWTGITSNGYGVQWFNGALHKVPRLMLEAFTNLTLTSGFDVCHTCSNRLCINPEHLYLGTRAMNMRQAVREGTVSKKLSPRQAKLIYGLTRSRLPGFPAYRFNKIIGEIFNVSYKLVEMIGNGKAWSEVTGARPR